MKKFFTLICVMICAVAANAASVDDLAVCKHSYVLVCDNYTANGTVAKRVQGTLFGAKHFLDVNDAGITAANKGNANLADPKSLTALQGQDLEALSAKYGKYGTHLNSLRLKNTQDVLAAKFTEGSKIIFVGQGNNKKGTAARIPKVSTSSDLSNPINEAPGADFGSTPAGYVYEVTIPADGTYYIGSYNGDMFLSYIIVEANEALGTPMVEAGDQKYEGGLWFAEVTCEPQDVTEDDISIKTVVTYTTDGSEPTAASPVYKEPIKVYKDCTVKFQAYYDYDGKGAAPTSEEDKIENADNEAVVTFSFNAPMLVCENGVVTVTSEYEGAKNQISVNGGEYAEGSSVSLTESAVVTAKSVITNGSYATFETMPASIDALVLTPITEEISVTVSGTASVDEEATATSTTGTIYAILDGVVNADKTKFFNKACQFKALANADAKNAKYQVPAGQEAYLMFGGDSKLYFEVGCDSVDVEVICSKNSCKTLNEEEDAAVTTDRKCFVNVSGKTYGYNNCEYAEDGKTVVSYTPAGEIKTTINFGLVKGSYYFAKYSGTGNILISSIKITPADATAIKNVETKANKTVAIYNLAGQKVSADYKGVVIKNGVKVLNK